MNGLAAKLQFNIDTMHTLAGYLGDLWKFNPNSRQWTILSDMIVGPRPLSRYSHAVSVVGSNRYVFGGFSEQGVAYFTFSKLLSTL
jgi:hypothetical protein